MRSDPLGGFTPQVREWFARSFEEPTEAQHQAWPAIAGGEHVIVSAPTGSGKTLAAFLWGLDRLVAEPQDGEGRAAGLRLAAEGALLRRREEPARAAEGHRRRHRRGDPHGRHAPEGPGGHAAQPARRADHHAGVALPDAHLAGAGDVRRHRVVHRRRDPRGGAHQARRASGADARAPPARLRPSTCSASACARPRSRSRRSGASSWAPAATAGWWTRACASRSTWRSACRWRTCASPTPTPTSPTWRETPAPPAARSGPRSTPSCWSWCGRTARRSSS